MLPTPTLSRLDREFQRLYIAEGPTPALGAAQVRAQVRALVLQVARPAQWQPVAAVWQGVQADLGLPAPAIAANGVDGLQLWFSLAVPVDEAEGCLFMELLRQRYLAEVPLARVAMTATAAPDPTPRAVQAGGPWAAFVAADLAPMFEESPWLDMPPNEEGQAELLAHLRSISPAALQAALALLQRQQPAAAGTAAQGGRAAQPHPQAAQFLLQVMNDTSAPLPLRVEAAKALLPYGPAT